MRDSLDDAMYDTVRDYRDGKNSGAVALAPKVNMIAGTLSNKVNPGMESYILGLKESIPIQLISGDFRIANSYCVELGGVFLRLPDIGPVSDAALLDIWARLAEEQGDAARAIRMALSDGNVTTKELGVIKKEIHEAICVWVELFKRIEGIYTQCETTRARYQLAPMKKINKKKGDGNVANS